MKFTITILTFLAGTLALLTEVRAQEVRLYTVNPIQLHGLQNYKGKYLTVYYGLGSRGSLTTSEDQITLREVKEKRSFQITDEALNIPEINLKRSNVFIPFNIIVFVIHDGPNFTWINGNSSVPDGELLTPNRSSQAVDSLTKIEFDQLKSSQNTASQKISISYSFGNGVPAEPL